MIINSTLPHHRQSALERQAIIWIGAPRSGKGTHCEKLMLLPGFIQFETGSALKKLAASDPHNPAYDPIRKRELVDASIVLAAFERWYSGIDLNVHTLLLDGIPRNISQMEKLIPFLLENGIVVRVIHFTTLPEVCSARSVREGRFEDADPDLVRKGNEVYISETLPIIGHLPRYGISRAHGNLLEIDNGRLMPAETAALIIPFAGAKCSADELFPPEKPLSHAMQRELTFA